MVAGIGFGEVAVGIGEAPLATCGAGIVAGLRLRIHAKLGHQTGVNVIEMEVSSNPKLRQLELLGAEHFARSADGIVRRMVEIVDVGDVAANFRCKEFRIESRKFAATSPTSTIST